MKSRVLFIAIVFIVSSYSTNAQYRFQRTYGGASDEEAKDVMETSDGGFLLCGYTTSFGSGGKDAYVIKTDYLGTKIWSKAIGGANDDEANYAIEKNGKYYIGGYTKSYGAGSADGFLTCLDATTGNIIWFKTYGTVKDDFHWLRFSKTMDNGFILAYPYTYDAYTMTLIKTDSVGTIEWSRSYGEHQCISGNVVQLADSGYLISGFTYEFGAGSHDFLLGRTDKNGNLVTAKTLGTSVNEGLGYTLYSLPNNEAFTSGTRDNSILGGVRDIVFIKFNVNTGSVSWAKVYGNTGKYFDTYTGGPTLDGGFATSLTDLSSSTNQDMRIIKTDSAGTVLWSKTYFGGSQSDVSNCLKNTSDNGFALAGYTTGFGAGNKDIYFVKTDPDGHLGSETQCNEGSETMLQADYPYTETYPVIPEVFPGGMMNSYTITAINITAETLGLLCYSDVNVHELNAQPFNIFPNPSNGSFNLQLKEVVDEATVEIFNSLGETVYISHISGNEKAINLEMTSGIYFIHLNSEEHLWTQKIIIE